MKILTLGLRQPIYDTLIHTLPQLSLGNARQVHHVEAKSFAHFAELFPEAGLAVADMATFAPAPLLQTLTECGMAHPAIPTILIPVPLIGTTHYQQLTTLGSTRGVRLPEPAETLMPHWWKQVAMDAAQRDVLSRFQAQVAHIAPEGEPGVVVRDIASFARAPSVKTLAILTDTDRSATATTKRRRLWERCMDAKLRAPGCLLQALRLLLLRRMQVETIWSGTTQALYLGYACQRSMSPWKPLCRYSVMATPYDRGFDISVAVRCPARAPYRVRAFFLACAASILAHSCSNVPAPLGSCLRAYSRGPVGGWYPAAPVAWINRTHSRPTNTSCSSWQVTRVGFRPSGRSQRKQRARVGMGGRVGVGELTRTW